MARNYNLRPVAPERKLAHVERIAIRWGDMDAMGHVNNIYYFRYMEQARIAWFESLLPRGEAAWKSHGIGRRMVEALADEARRFSLDVVFAFTYVADFFRRMGFQEVERGELPLKVFDLGLCHGAVHGLGDLFGLAVQRLP